MITGIPGHDETVRIMHTYTYANPPNIAMNGDKTGVNGTYGPSFTISKIGLQWAEFTGVSSMEGEILEIYVSDITSKRETIEGILAWKWGLQNSLPATHKYRYIWPRG